MYNASYEQARTCDSTYKSYKMVSHKDEHWEPSDLTCLTLRLCEAPQHEKWVCIKSYLHFLLTIHQHSAETSPPLSSVRSCPKFNQIPNTRFRRILFYRYIFWFSLPSASCFLLSVASFLLVCEISFLDFFFCWLTLFFFLIQPIFLWWKLHELHNLFHLE